MGAKSKSQLSKTDIKILVIVLLFIATLIIGLCEYFLFYTKQNEKIEENNQLLVSLQDKVEEAKGVPNKIARYKELIAKLEGVGSDTDDDESKAELMKKLDLPSILAIVESSATNANLELSSISMDGNAAYVKANSDLASRYEAMDNGGEEGNTEATEGNESFWKLGISLSVNKVTYEGLMEFLSNVEDAGYYVTTSEANLNTSDGINYSGDIKFALYSLVPANKS